MTTQTWDTALTRDGNGMKLIFPATVARALREAGMWRATLIITEEGLLVKPYVAEPVGQGNRSQAAIVLPESWK